jgi:hypothetical protein
MACGVDKTVLEGLGGGDLWEGLNPWLYGICVVTFDLELGQAIESIYPPTSPLSDQDKTAICYLAFPDSNSGCMGDTKFHFRFILPTLPQYIITFLFSMIRFMYLSTII